MSIKKEDQDGNLNQLLGTLLVPQTPPNKYKNQFWLTFYVQIKDPSGGN